MPTLCKCHKNTFFFKPLCTFLWSLELIGHQAVNLPLYQVLLSHYSLWFLFFYVSSLFLASSSKLETKLLLFCSYEAPRSVCLGPWQGLCPATVLYSASLGNRWEGKYLHSFKIYMNWVSQVPKKITLETELKPSLFWCSNYEMLTSFIASKDGAKYGEETNKIISKLQQNGYMYVMFFW